MLTTTYERVMAENGRKQRKKALPNRQLPYEGGITAEDLQLRVQIEHEHQMAINWYRGVLRLLQRRRLRGLSSAVPIAESQGTSAIGAQL
jgi:hypothetical protein